MYDPTAVNQQIQTFITLVKNRILLHNSLQLLSCIPNSDILKSFIDYDKTNGVDDKIKEINEKLISLISLYISIHKLKDDKYKSKKTVKSTDAFLSNYDVWPDVKRRFFKKMDEWNDKTEMKVNVGFQSMSQSPSIQVAYSMQNLEKSLKKCFPLQLPDKYIGKDVFDALGASSDLLLTIYTDHEFYIHLFKELANVDNMPLDKKRFEEGQKELYSRKKKKSVPRESKERRIRYITHEKLNHFMEPTPPKYNLPPNVIDLYISSLFK